MAYPSLRRFGRSQGRLTVIKVVGGEMHVRFGQPNVDDFATRLEELGLRMQDLQPVLDKFGRYLVREHIPGQFAAQGHPKRWASLSPAYARWKARHFPGRPILVRTGAMKGGFRYEARKRSLRVINRVKAGQKGRGKPRWFYHQHGTGNMPARPVLQISDADRQKLSELANEYLEASGG